MFKIFNQKRFITLFIFALTLISRLATAQTDDFEERTFTDADGKSIPYRLLKPLNFDSTQKYPVILFFHGAGQRGNDNKAQLTQGIPYFITASSRKKFPCFVIAPQCPKDQQWVNMPWGGLSGTRPATPSEAMKLALKALDSVENEFNTDKNKTYITGISMGGYATWDCVTRFPERFAAAVPICGGGDENTITEETAKVPLWAFHSNDDKVVKVERTQNMIQALKNKGGNPAYTEYTGLGHISWNKAYSESKLLPWIFSQQLGSPVISPQ